MKSGWNLIFKNCILGATFVKSSNRSTKFVKSYESGSDWETEDESSNQTNEKNEAIEDITEKTEKIVLVSEEKMSFKSILKKPPVKNPILNELSDVIAAPIKKSKIKGKN